MSNFLAIATATAALQESLSAVVQQNVSGAVVTTGRPDSLTDQQDPLVNVYLYGVGPNAAWRNADLPTRRPNGEIMQRPCAALTLYYLLSFYGDDSTLEPERLLGSVIELLHTQPILDRKRVAETINGRPFLNGSEPPRSNLDQQVELVRFAPLTLSLEELSKLWSVFFQTPYTLSVAYQASVVLIEADETPRTALPVRERNVYAVPFRQPVITALEAQSGANQPIGAESTVLIRGHQLRGEVTLVRIGNAEPLEPESVSDTTITLLLPAALRAGVQGVQVFHQFLMGTPETPHLGVESNVAAFVLQPTIIDAPSFTAAADDDPPRVTVNLNPPVGKKQRVTLLLDELQPAPPPDPPPARSYSFALPAREDENDSDDTDTTLEIPVSGTEAGTYLVRVQVDGATSPLEVDTDEESPTFNRFIAPLVTIG